MWYCIRSQRVGSPFELIIKASEINGGVYQYLSNGPLLAYTWVNKRSMYFLSQCTLVSVFEAL